MLIVTATSLATIVPASLSLITVKVTLTEAYVILGSVILIGVVINSLLVTQQGGQWLSASFDLIGSLSAPNMMFRAGKASLTYTLLGKLEQHVVASGIGFFNAMLRIGDGTFSLPTLPTYRYRA